MARSTAKPSSVKFLPPDLKSQFGCGLTSDFEGRRSTAWGNRQQAPGFPHDSHRRIQLAGVTKAGKLYPTAVQQFGADQKRGAL
jgi:hypothetical protein